MHQSRTHSEELYEEEPILLDVTKPYDPAIVGYVTAEDSMRESEKKPTSSVLGASFNLANTIVGAGIMGLAFAIMECGFVAGIILMCFVVLVTEYSVQLMVKTGLRENKTTYEDLCEHALGRFGFIIVLLLIFMFAVGCMISYFIVIGDTIPQVFARTLSPDHFLADRQNVVILTGIFIIFPISCLKHMSFLQYTSGMSLVAVIFIVCAVSIRGPPTGQDLGIHPDTDELGLNIINADILAGAGALTFAFTCHHSAFIIRSSLHDPTPARWTRTLRCGLTIAFTVSIITAIFGYCSFYSHTEGNILNNFDYTDDVINGARIALAITMLFTYPMEHFVARYCIQAILEGYVSKTNFAHGGFTVIIFIATFVPGIYLDDLGIVLELNGALTASAVAYMLPPICYFCIVGSPWALWRRAIPSDSNWYWYIIKDVVCPCFVLLFGVIALVGGTGYILHREILV